jgi:cation transport regulator ChaC
MSSFIFGYGSLVWKADFPFIIKHKCSLQGYVRRFWQLSTDHRGTLSTPGRVVTLIPFEQWTKEFSKLDPNISLDDSKVDGYLYEIMDKDKSKVFDYLDYREKNGYELKTVKVTLKDTNESIECFLYIASTKNDDFVKSDIEFDLDYISRVIAYTKGPSGYNHEYLQELVLALEAAGMHVDDHLLDLQSRVLAILNKTS